MSQTFEELATRHLDGLYHGALFLAAGEPDTAERLLLETLATSFRRFRARDASSDVGPWLEGRLVSTFLDSDGHDGSLLPLDVPATPMPFDTGALDALDGRGLHAAAGTVPAIARAALWLVLLRRWPYDDASATLGVDLHGLKDLLRYRHSLMRAILGGHGRGLRGSRGSGA